MVSRLAVNELFGVRIPASELIYKGVNMTITSDLIKGTKVAPNGAGSEGDQVGGHGTGDAVGESARKGQGIKDVTNNVTKK